MTTTTMTTTTTETSGGGLLGAVVLLVLVGIPTAYAVGLWWVLFGRVETRSDQTDENVAVTRDKKE